MSLPTLPKRHPFSEIFEVHFAEGVLLTCFGNDLKDCRPAERMLIDVLADDVEKFGDDVFRFQYEKATFQKLCHLLAEMSPENDLSAIGTDGAAEDGKLCGHKVAWPRPKADPKGGTT